MKITVNFLESVSRNSLDTFSILDRNWYHLCTWLKPSSMQISKHPENTLAVCVTRGVSFVHTHTAHAFEFDLKHSTCWKTKKLYKKQMSIIELQLSVLVLLFFYIFFGISCAFWSDTHAFMQWMLIWNTSNGTDCWMKSFHCLRF